MKALLIVLGLIALAFLFSYTCSAQVFPAVVPPAPAAPPAPDSVVVVVADTGTYGSGTNTNINKSINFGTSDNRAAVIGVNWFIDGATGSVDSVKVGTVKASLKKSTYSANYGGAESWVAYGIGTGSQTVTVYFHGASAMDVGFTVLGVSNALQTFTETDTVSRPETTDGRCGSSDITVNVPTQTGSLAVVNVLPWSAPGEEVAATSPAVIRANATWGSHPAPRVTVSQWHDGSTPTGVTFCLKNDGSIANTITALSLRKYTP